jgi:hypothetical protein
MGRTVPDYGFGRCDGHHEMSDKLADRLVKGRSFNGAIPLQYIHSRADHIRVGSRAVPGLGQKLLNRMELSNDLLVILDSPRETRDEST